MTANTFNALTAADIPYQGDLLAGVDEAGRGPLVGPVVAAAVILNPQRPIEGLTDSKRLSEKKRLELATQIKQESLAWAIASASVAEIDELNILQASLLAMHRAIEQLEVAAEFALIDGKQIPPQVKIAAMPVIKGDARHPAISAASILAKVERDSLLIELDAVYPQYGLAQHKGYPTKAHLAALQQYGACPEHRRSYKPVREALANPPKQ